MATPPDHHHVAAHKRRPPLHPLERWLVGVLIVLLLWLPWAFAGVYSWVQIPAAALAALALGLALATRRYSDHLAPGGNFTLVMWPRLMRFPPFWLGLGLLALLLVQASNPAWVRHEAGTAWWLTPREHVSWLPQSAPGPFLWMNVWRAFIVYLGAWLAVCAVWVGITRRRALRVLLGAIIGNGVVLAVVGMVHRATRPSPENWLWTDRVFEGGGTPFASFVYQNHGGGFVALIAGGAAALAAWHWAEARKRLSRSNPGGVWLIGLALLGLATAVSGSRGATLSFSGFAVAASGAYLYLRRFAPVRSTTPALVGVAVALLFAGVFAFFVRHADLGEVSRKLEMFSRQGASEASFAARAQVREVALDMYRDYWLLGSGAGSFRWVFPLYLEQHPDKAELRTAFWDSAHCDWLQIPIELGLPGVMLIGGAFGWLMAVFGRHRGWRHPVALFVVLGCAQTLAHAWFDFPFEAPSILVTWWVLLVAALRWLELESEGG